MKKSTPTTDTQDMRWMAAALRLAARGLGRVAPNPAVGCLIVKDNQLIGRGWTQPGGRPHAETEALAMSGPDARGATAYVTLEPCAHYGQTPPCAEALVAAGVARVVMACMDPDARVNGTGIEILRRAGVEVLAGVLEADAEAVNAGFLLSKTEGRPMVSLKIATDINGGMTTPAGQSPWITGSLARDWGHGLRARHDAIVTGSGTFVEDEPQLNCRLPGLEDRSPCRLVWDRRGRLQDRAGWSICRHADAATLLADFAGQGVTRLLIEAGPSLSGHMLQTGLVDRLYWFKAPHEVPGSAAPEGLEQVLSDWVCKKISYCTPDQLEVWQPMA